jgi:hypothetical protein
MLGAFYRVGEQMPRHVAIVIVHGVLSDDTKFAGPMMQGLTRQLEDINTFVHFRTVFWADQVRDHQGEYLGQVGARIKHKKLRRLVVEGLGDAAAYQKTNARENSVYYDVQDKIHEKIRDLDRQNQLQNRGLCPLIFVGHSLGSHIVSSFVWDVNKLKQRPASYIKGHHDPAAVALWDELNAEGVTSFRRLETFAGVALPSDLAGKARWLNFYSKRDVLGYPVKPLNNFFGEEPRIEDICVQSESPISKLIPYWSCYSAHTGYWTNKEVLDKTSALIRDVAR